MNTRVVRWVVQGILLLGLAAAGCATFGPPGDSFSIAAEAQYGDPARRASTRLLLRGLKADESWHFREAVVLYERALQVDPTNPWAYLCRARFEVAQGDPERALDYLDKVEALLPSEPGAAGARAHLAGLRGTALAILGYTSRAEPLLAAAKRGAPRKWADGQLDASELQ